MLVNNVDIDTIGFLIDKEVSEGEIVQEYEPAIMWNLKVERYILL